MARVRQDNSIMSYYYIIYGGPLVPSTVGARCLVFIHYSEAAPRERERRGRDDRRCHDREPARACGTPGRETPRAKRPKAKPKNPSPAARAPRDTVTRNGLPPVMADARTRTHPGPHPHRKTKAKRSLPRQRCGPVDPRVDPPRLCHPLPPGHALQPTPETQNALLRSCYSRIIQHDAHARRPGPQAASIGELTREMRGIGSPDGGDGASMAKFAGLQTSSTPKA